jgi:hypothetical protein
MTPKICFCKSDHWWRMAEAEEEGRKNNMVVENP